MAIHTHVIFRPDDINKKTSTNFRRTWVHVLPICYACKNYIGSFEQIHCK